MTRPFAVEAGYAHILAEVARLRDQITVAQTAAAESALAAQVYRNRIRNVENYLLTAADDTRIEELRRDLLALLVGGMS